MAEQSKWIINPTAETLEKDVIERSREVPVIVDFWAPWCEPCQQLAPILEKLTNEANGRFILAKIDIEKEEQLAAMFGVQSIPFVVALRDGQPVNQFMGILPEDQLREWIDTFLPSPAEEAVAAGQAVEATDPQAAEVKYREAAEFAPQDNAIKIHLARTLVTLERYDDCRSIIDELATRGYLEPEAEKLKSQLDLHESAAESGGVEEARRGVEADPEDLTKQITLAEALAGSKKYQEALEICLEIVRKDKTGVGMEAKETMVQIFDTLGPASELTSDYRRKLSTLLY